MDSLVSNFDNFIEGPPETKTKIFLKTTNNQIIVAFDYEIPKYWATTSRLKLYNNL